MILTHRHSTHKYSILHSFLFNYRTVYDVRKWLIWAIKQFNLADIKIKDWNITGQQLCDMTHKQFQTLVPNDPKNVFWTHLELLRKCKFVGMFTLIIISNFGN